MGRPLRPPKAAHSLVSSKLLLRALRSLGKTESCPGCQISRIRGQGHSQKVCCGAGLVSSTTRTAHCPRQPLPSPASTGKKADIHQSTGSGWNLQACPLCCSRAPPHRPHHPYTAKCHPWTEDVPISGRDIFVSAGPFMHNSDPKDYINQ